MCVNAPPFSTIFKKTLKVPIDNFKILDYSQGITHRLLNHPVIDIGKTIFLRKKAQYSSKNVSKTL